jgi:hypothetical protein
MPHALKKEAWSRLSRNSKWKGKQTEAERSNITSKRGACIVLYRSMLLKCKPDMHASFRLDIIKVSKFEATIRHKTASIEDYYVECYAGRKLVARFDPREISEHQGHARSLSMY